MTLRLVLPIPAQGGSEVGKQFVDVIETYNPVKITLLKHAGLEQEGEEAAVLGRLGLLRRMQAVQT